MADSPRSDISGLVNFRDLGGHPTRDGVTRHDRVFRSDSLAHAAPDDVVHLVEERGVRTVVDLRGAAEVDAFPNQPMAGAGVTIHHVPLIDPEKREQSGLDWETMTLVDLYRFLLESAGSEFVEVLQIIAEPANHPLVFHCAAGKDREEIKRTADIFRGRIIDVSDNTYTIELTGAGQKLDAFIQALDAGAIIETVRTGASGIGRGNRILRA